MSSPELVCWCFTVQYTYDFTKKAKTFHDGKLKYFPASKKATVFDMVGAIVDELEPASACGLVPDGELKLTRTMVHVMSPMSLDDNIPLTPTVIEQKELSIQDNNNTQLTPSSTAAGSLMPTRLQHEILFTADKTKKAKTWQDGWMNLDKVSKTIIFYDEQDRIIHRKKIGAVQEVAEGSLLTTSSYLIEITGPILQNRKAVKKLKLTDADDTGECEYGPTISFSTPIVEIEMLYTADKIRKSKRWKDGLFRWTEATGQGLFLDEEGKTIHRRKLLGTELVEGKEISTAQYIFQFGSVKADYIVKEAVDLVGSETFQKVPKEHPPTTIKRPKVSTLMPNNKIFTKPPMAASAGRNSIRFDDPLA